MSQRHRTRGKQLGRNTKQRKALFKGLLNSLILNEEVKTTQTKAKVIQGLFDKLVTKAKPATIHARRLLHAFLGDKNSTNKLVDELTTRFGKRNSGFTRVTKLGLRKGDNAPVVKLEIIDKKAPEAKEEKAKAKKSAPKTKK